MFEGGKKSGRPELARVPWTPGTSTVIPALHLLVLSYAIPYSLIRASYMPAWAERVNEFGTLAVGI